MKNSSTLLVVLSLGFLAGCSRTPGEPTGGASSWKANGYLEPTGYSLISGIDCPSTTLCLGVGYGNSSTGMATASLTPTQAASSWKDTSIASNPPAPNGGVVDAISCSFFLTSRFTPS